MRKRIKEILKDRRASSFPMTIGIVLSLIILMCGISEYFRLQVIAAGVREAVEDAVISTVNDNYAGVYHGVREGYSGSYVALFCKREGGIGGGDIKLAGATGLVLGLPASLTASCLGLTGFVMYGCMVCLWNRFKGKRDKEAFPVGPFLAGGAAAVYCMRLGGWMI